MRYYSVSIWLFLMGFREGDSSDCNSPNVRTVIFRQGDLEKECWSREEVALLYTRRIMQELIPKKKPHGLPLMLDYFKMCLRTLRGLARSKRAHALAVTALSDTLGGYLQAFGLPMARQAYYEGTLSFGVARQLHECQWAFKRLLRTDGGGWTRPIRVKRSAHINPLVTSKSPMENACRFLITKNELSGSTGYRRKEDDHVDIVMPFLDDVNRPTAIALPFKDRNLYSLSSKTSSNILVKYYVRAVQCLSLTYGTCAIPESGPSSVPQAQAFLYGFNQWINTYVLPHLHDDIWYPGFGSVWRIVETIKKKGGQGGVEGDSGKEGGICTMQLDSGPAAGEEPVEETSKRFYIIVIACVVIIFWLIVLLIYLIYKYFFSKKDQNQNSSSSEGGDSSPEEGTDEEGKPTTASDEETAEGDEGEEKKEEKK